MINAEQFQIYLIKTINLKILKEAKDTQNGNSVPLT